MEDQRWIIQFKENRRGFMVIGGSHGVGIRTLIAMVMLQQNPVAVEELRLKRVHIKSKRSEVEAGAMVYQVSATPDQFRTVGAYVRKVLETSENE